MSAMPSVDEEPAPPPDGELVAGARAGSAAAFRMLYDRWRPAVSRVARSFAEIDRDEAEDVVQETFVRAFRQLGRLVDTTRFGPWVLTIARNRALTRLARHRSAARVTADLAREVESSGEAAPDPLDPGVEAEVEIVRAAIAALPDGAEKETVRLFYVEGSLSAREIADRMGVGKSAVTMRLERFRAKIKLKLMAEVARLRGRESRG